LTKRSRPARAVAREPARPRRRDHRLWIAAALVGLTLAVYAPVRHHDFVNLDDAQYVSQNPAVLAGLTWQGVAWAFTAGHAGNWHPLTWISHMIDVELFGRGAGGPHLTNLVLHMASAVLLFWLLASLTGAPFRSGAVAALFAVHPLHVESVAWVAERKDVLSTLLWVLTIWSYVGWVRRPAASRYWVLCAVFALALMAKPMVVTLPFVLLLLDVWPLGRRGFQSSWVPLVREKAPLFVLALASSVVTLVVQSHAGAVQAAGAFPIGQRVANALVAYVTYLRQAIWPAGLAALYPYPSSIPPWQVGAALAGLAGASWLAVRAASRHPSVLVGWLWYLGTLGPVIGLIQVGSQPFADRYTYVPLIGVFIVAAWGLPDLVGGTRAGRTVLAGAAVVAIAGCAVAARQQVSHWKDGVALWTHAVGVTRDNYRAYTNLGQALTAAGRARDAVPAFDAALRINPTFAEAHNYFGLALMEVGETARAIGHYRDAIRLRPRFVEARNNLGLALASAGQLDAAQREFSEALHLDPGFAPARTNLGIALAQLGRLDDAEREFREAVRLQPDSVEAHLNLAAALADLGRRPEAIRELEAVLRIDPSHAAARQLLAQLRRD
jgi:Flp pilus assembly protein TadD